MGCVVGFGVVLDGAISVEKRERIVRRCHVRDGVVCQCYEALERGRLEVVADRLQVGAQLLWVGERRRRAGALTARSGDERGARGEAAPCTTRTRHAASGVGVGGTQTAT